MPNLTDTALGYLRAVVARSITWAPEEHEATAALDEVQTELTDLRAKEQTLTELRATLAAWERSYDKRAAQLTREGWPEGAYISQTRAGVVREVFDIIGRDNPEA